MAVDPRNVVTYTAPTNIAVIKYWGKGDVKLNTPMNSSVSVTLEQDDLHTITTVAASKAFTANRLWLNGKEIEINSRGVKVLGEILKIAGDRVDPATGEVLIKRNEWSSYHVHISSVNTFPTGAGLASSAAGLACMVKALGDLFCVKETFPGQLTAIARQGSGSASRSLYGGFVEWRKGSRADGQDSIAVQVADENHWEDLAAVILVVSEKEKDTSSTSGMETSKRTSELLTHRAASIVDKRMDAIKAAYLAKDFATFGEITMKDSNQFHATCLDTYPPIFYMNDTSHDIIRLVHVINNHYGKVVAAYTFDAGPNAVIYTLKEHVPMLVAVMSYFFPSNSPNVADYCNKPAEFKAHDAARSSLVNAEFMQKLTATGRPSRANDVKYMFITKAGPGPVKQPIEEALIDTTTGQYKAPSSKHKRLNIGSTNAAPAAAVAASGCPFAGAATAATSCCPIASNRCGGNAGGCCRPNAAVVAAVGAIALLGYLYFGKKGCCFAGSK